MESITVVDAKSGLIQVTGKLVIKNFAEVMAGFKPGRFILSDPFNVGDAPMAIKVYLNGRDNKETGNVGVFLMNHSDADINVKCQLNTDVATWEFSYTDKVDARGGWGNAEFLTHAKCAEAFKEKDFVVMISPPYGRQTCQDDRGGSCCTNFCQDQYWVQLGRKRRGERNEGKALVYFIRAFSQQWLIAPSGGCYHVTIQ